MWSYIVSWYNSQANTQPLIDPDIESDDLEIVTYVSLHEFKKTQELIRNTRKLHKRIVKPILADKKKN